MNRSPTPSSGGIQSAAAAWVIRHDAGLSAAECADFEQWLAADPLHAAAWARNQETWGALDLPRKAGQSDRLLENLAARASSRRRRCWITAAAAGCALAAGALWEMAPARRSPQGRGLTDANGARLIAPERRQLPDGSVIELKPDSEIATAFSPQVRQVTLVRGEAQFQVVHNPNRPFVVKAGTVEVRDLGTVFSIQLGAKQTEILVTEGNVSVAGASANQSVQTEAANLHSTIVSAGSRVVVPAGPAASESPSPTAVSTAEIEDQLSWLHPRLEFTDTPLGEAVALIKGHSDTQFVIADQSLKQVRISGFFRLDNSDTFVRMLEASFGVKAERRGQTITLRKAD